MFQFDPLCVCVCACVCFKKEEKFCDLWVLASGNSSLMISEFWVLHSSISYGLGWVGLSVWFGDLF